jgi:hypothetical protein
VLLTRSTAAIRIRNHLRFDEETSCPKQSSNSVAQSAFLQPIHNSKVHVLTNA